MANDDESPSDREWYRAPSTRSSATTGPAAATCSPISKASAAAPSPSDPTSSPSTLNYRYPTFYRSVTALDLRGRTQTDVELRDLGLAVNQNQMARFYPLFKELGVTPASELVNLPGGTEVLVAGVRRATHTPPMRSGKRFVFLSLNDGSGPVSILRASSTSKRLREVADYIEKKYPILFARKDNGSTRTRMARPLMSAARAMPR